MDDLGVVYPAQVSRGDAEVGVAKLALYDDKRDTFSAHLDRVRVAQLVRRKPAPDPRRESHIA